MKISEFIKKCMYILFIAIVLLSCDKERENNLENNVENDLTKDMIAETDSIFVGDSIIEIVPPEIETYRISRKAATELYELIDFPINIVVRQNSTSARYLTHQELNKELIFKDKIDGSKSYQQTYYLGYVPLSGELVIYTDARKAGLLGQTRPPERRIVSAGTYSSDPNTKVLYVRDGNSLMGARWDINPSQRMPGAYIISNNDLFVTGGSSWWDVYKLVIGSNNSKVVFGKYDNKATQEFEIRPKEEFDM